MLSAPTLPVTSAGVMMRVPAVLRSINCGVVLSNLFDHVVLVNKGRIGPQMPSVNGAPPPVSGGSSHINGDVLDLSPEPEHERRRINVSGESITSIPEERVPRRRSVACALSHNPESQRYDIYMGPTHPCSCER